MRRSLVVALVLGAAAFAPAASAAPSCKHQLVDPVGDVSSGTPTVVVPSRAVDLVAADVRTDARNLYAKVQVDDIPDETGTPVADLAYRVTITMNAQSYWLDFDNMKLDGATANAWHVTAGDSSPEDNPNGGAGAGELAGPGTWVVDVHKNTVLMTFPRSVFTKAGGVGKKITDLHAISWWGNGLHANGSFEGSYVGADTARSNAVYVTGKPSCA